MHVFRRLVAVLVAAGGSLLWGCDARVQLAEPTASSGEPATLTVVATDTALAQRAGWIPGVPATTVFVRRNEDPTILSFTTDSQGVLSLPGLPAADYWIWAERRPSGAELEPPVLAPPALGGGRRASLDRGSNTTMDLREQQSGSLVISEFYYHPPPRTVYGTGSNYEFHWYIELYNDSDTTVYLDGKIVGAGFNYHLDAPLWPCTETEPFRDDPRGIWSQRFQAFPGSGREHPLAPGRTVVIAEQAIDHSTIYPGLPDLSHADFQFSWPTRALNPAVPTMLPIQLSTGALQTMFLGPSVAFVAEPVDVPSLARDHGRYQGDFALFPRDAILDVAVIYRDYTVVSPTGIPYCRTLVAPSLDALSAFVGPSEASYPGTSHLVSAQRKVLPDGRHLQRTGTSAADWTVRPRSPGQVP